MTANQCSTQLSESITTEAYVEFGFTQVNAWLWICREHNLRIEHYGDFSGTFFSILKPYYLFNLSDIVTPFCGEEIAAGNVAEIVNAIRKLIVA